MNSYTIAVYPKQNSPYNPIHSIVQGRSGHLLEAVKGERGWIAYKIDEEEGFGSSPWHRLHTSLIDDIIEYDNGNIDIVTEHTTYSLKVVEDDK